MFRVGPASVPETSSLNILGWLAPRKRGDAGSSPAVLVKFLSRCGVTVATAVSKTDAQGACRFDSYQRDQFCLSGGMGYTTGREPVAY